MQINVKSINSFQMLREICVGEECTVGDLLISTLDVTDFKDDIDVKPDCATYAEFGFCNKPQFKDYLTKNCEMFCGPCGK